jgi:hypothetical protein
MFKSNFYKIYWSISLTLSLLGNLTTSAMGQNPILSTEQIPSSSQLSNPTALKYSARVQNVLGFGSFRHKGRSFAAYQFQGKQNQLIRISLVGGLASQRNPNELRTGSLLVNPVLILLDPQGQMIAQQPDNLNSPNALIRLNLPTTGKYIILVTSSNYNTGGKYTLTLQHLK